MSIVIGVVVNHMALTARGLPTLWGALGFRLGRHGAQPFGENPGFGIGREQQEPRHAVSGEKVGGLALVLLEGVAVAHAGVSLGDCREA
jgi:hypothetical protein